MKSQVDFVVVGAGAAGGIVAKELSTAGFRTVVLEQGPYLNENDFQHDELKFQDLYFPGVGQPFLTNDPKRQPNTFRKTPSEQARLKPTVQYGCMVGGGTVHFTANYWRFHEIDFIERSRWGTIAGTGFSDWPITYADLEPYYTKAEYEWGVSGLAGASPFDPPRSKPYPLPPLPVKSSGVLFEHPLNEFKSVQVTRVVHDFYDSDPKRGFYGGGGLDARFGFYPISFALAALPPDVPKWGAGFKTALQEYFNRSMFLLAHTTALPRESNSISLDPEVMDAWGLPAIRVTYKDHPDDLRTMQFFQDGELELLEAAGARKKWGFPVEETTASVHPLGTCRMGNDPKFSVVDRNHRSHDVPNLFIVDGSSFVTSGRNQPTATIQALAYRAAEKIIESARKGEIKAPLS